MFDKPYSESCDQNREPILEVIRPLLLETKTVLEIGSGTGQHAVYFAAKLPHLIWQTSDRLPMLTGISRWLAEARLTNTPTPIELDVSHEWPGLSVDAVFSANTTHIMHWHAVEAMFTGIGRILRPEGRFLLYGTFNYCGTYSSESNARFDCWLKTRDPDSGIRNFEDLARLGEIAGIIFEQKYDMPHNNQILSWRRS